MARRPSVSLIMLASGAALLVMVGLARPAGSATAGDAGEARKGGTLRLSRWADVAVDPALAYDAWSWTLEFATCAKLFNYPDEPGAAGTRVIPEVVSSFTRSRDRRTYTFELKRTYRFHTGAPVTARSFAAAFNRDANPRMDSPAVTYLDEIVGADAVIAGKARTISGVRVLGRYRLRIRLTRPLGDFIARLTMPFFCPIPPNTPIDSEVIDDPAGSGPYYVSERIPNRRIVLRRNPFYRGDRPGNVDQIVWTIGESPEVCQLATEQDRIDHCVNNVLPDVTWRRIAQQYGINRRGGQLFATPVLTTWYFAFNHDRPAFKGHGQIPLKKAINYAIDRPALARLRGYLGARRTDQMLPLALGRNASIYPIRGADPATARSWLARASFQPTKLVLYTSNRRLGVGGADLFAFNMKQIGIDVEVEYFDPAALIERARRRGEPYDVVLHDWGADYPDGAGFLEPLLSTQRGNMNLSYFDDPKTNARMEAAGGLTGEARRRAWAELDLDLMREDPPWAPAVHGMSVDFVSPSFGCYLKHPMYGVDLAAACKK
jgi:ABC-type oligopeptide transport system substrate-binding subunit